jgi:hypothetical protein
MGNVKRGIAELQSLSGNEVRLGPGEKMRSHSDSRWLHYWMAIFIDCWICL